MQFTQLLEQQGRRQTTPFVGIQRSTGHTAVNQTVLSLN